MIERFSIDALADALDERLAVSDAELLQRYPGDPGTRQPVHTVYVPADRYAARLVLDGARGTLILHPSARRARVAAGDMSRRRLAAQRAHELRDQPAITTDDERITVLANVASAEELEVGLRAGAEGIGLLRTELAFLDATDWPSEREHTEALRPILSGLENRRAVVRVLDFGADKSPPFLRGIHTRGLELLLIHPGPFIRQLRAILVTAQGHEAQILLPMVEKLP